MVTTKPWARYTEFVAGCAPNLRYLTFTLGNENNLFEAEQDIVPNAKKWRLSEVLHTKGSNSFEEFSWVDQLRAFGSLNVMEVEIGTLKKNKEKLDLYIAKAAGWRIPLAKEKEMVFNPGKTKWEGWHGLSLGESCLLIVPLACVVSTLGDTVPKRARFL